MLAFLALALASQDLADEWADRVSRELILDRGPLPRQPVRHTLHLGAHAAYESNVNLESSDEDAETVLVPFLRARLEYSERQFDATADLLGLYKRYVPDEEFSDDEERLFGRVRFVSPRLTLEAAEIFQHVSDPVDVVFADRVDRFVSDTLGRARVELSSVFALEADLHLGVVRFREKSFDDGDHWSLRGSLGAVGRLSSGLEAVVQGGGFLIDYRYRTGAPPDVDGLFARGGLRGELSPTLHATLLLGVARASSDDFESGAEGEEEETGEVAAHLRWRASEKLTLHADLSRQFAFALVTDPFQIVNRAIFSADYELAQTFRLLGRVQVDRAEGASGLERDYGSAGATLRWQSHEQVYFDTGVLYRRGEVSEADVDYDDWSIQIGVVVTN